MAALTGDACVPIRVTVADIKVGVCVAVPFWLPSTDTTDTGIAVVVACRVRNSDVTEPAPTIIRRLCYKIDPSMLESADIYAMNPNI